MTEIAVAVITGVFAFLGNWVQNRRTRKAVAPVSNGFAAHVKASLADSQASMLELHKKVDRLDARLDDHLEEHRRAENVIPFQRRVI